MNGAFKKIYRNNKKYHIQHKRKKGKWMKYLIAKIKWSINKEKY